MNEVQMTLSSIAFTWGQCCTQVTENMLGAKRGAQMARQLINLREDEWNNLLANLVARRALPKMMGRNISVSQLDALEEPYTPIQKLGLIVAHGLHGFCSPLSY